MKKRRYVEIVLKYLAVSAFGISMFFFGLLNNPNKPTLVMEVSECVAPDEAAPVTEL